MIFDGAEILVGDQVFDFVFGSGVVEHLIPTEDKFIVRFGKGRYTYGIAGNCVFPNKTLYWKNPVQGYVPMKDDAKWNHFCKLRDAIASVIWRE